MKNSSIFNQSNIQLDKKHNLYIIKVYGNNNQILIKFGYSNNIINRLNIYFHSNPLVELIGTYYRKDAKLFELYFHSKYKSKILREWYDETILSVLLNEIETISEVNYDIKNIKIDNDIIQNKKFTFYHITGIIEQNISIQEMYIKYKLNKQFLYHMAIGINKSTYGWAINKNNLKTAEGILKCNSKYNFYHKLGDILYDLTIEEFCKKFNYKDITHIKSYFRTNNIYKNWSIVEIPKYNFQNKKTKQVINATIHYMVNITKSTLLNFKQLILKKRKYAGGWIYIE